MTTFGRIARSAVLVAVLIVWGRPPVVFAQSDMPPEHATEQVLDVTEMTTWVERDGRFGAVDPRSGINGTYPKDVPVGVVYAQGLVWGGQVVDGTEPALRVGGSTYRSGLRPGNVVVADDGTILGAADPNDTARFHVWRVHRQWQSLGYTEAAVQYYGVEARDVTDVQREALRAQYEYDWTHWPAELGAPYEDVDGDGAYDPAVDVPGQTGASQTLWLVTNDLDPAKMAAFHGAPPIGIEHQLTIWGYDLPETTAAGALQNLHFRQSRLIYTGTPTTSSEAHIDSMFVAFWADPDLGRYSDDYCGVDTARGLAFVYNADDTDAAYDTLGLAPPVVGWDLVRGPEADDGEPLEPTAFICNGSGDDLIDPVMGEYVGTQEWYRYMRGVRAFPPGEPFINPLTDESTSFMLPGDPVTGAGWIDGIQLPPGDRRLLLSSGPFTMQRGDTVDVVLAQIGARGQSRLSGLRVLELYDDVAQFFVAEDEEATSVTDRTTPKGAPGIRSVYPNPSRGVVQLRLTDAPGSRYTVAVYDLLGRRVAAQRVPAGAQAVRGVAVDLSRQAAGTYVLVVEDGDGRPVDRRLVMLVP